MEKINHLGERTITKQGYLIEIIEYNNCHDITIQFEDGVKVRGCYSQFKKKCFQHPFYKTHQERIGEENINIHGEKMHIVEYNNSTDIIVEFEDGTQVKTQYGNFKRGITGNPNSRTILGVGHMDLDLHCRNEKTYYTWYNMLYRCYSQNCKQRVPTYEKVRCCEEWLYYSNFYRWALNQENYYNWYDNSRSGLDKDILIKHNELYAPDRCFLVPTRINTLFIKADKVRGDLPIGVRYENNIYRACCSVNNKIQYIGTANSPEQAFLLYKDFKEKHIKEKAKEYYLKGEISRGCYEAMLNYEVDIDD